jgi:hypothetical protein
VKHYGTVYILPGALNVNKFLLKTGSHEKKFSSFPQIQKSTVSLFLIEQNMASFHTKIRIFTCIAQDI